MSDKILYINMFGDFSLTYGNKQICCQNSRSKLIWNILAYLLIHRGEFITADELISILWKQERNNNPSGAMRTAIHRARAMLSELVDDPSLQVLIFKNGGYMWNPDIDTVVDIDVFENQVAAISSDSDDVSAYLAALDTYSGKFLPAQSSEHWVMPLQTYYHNLFESLVDSAIPLLERQRRYSECIQICNRSLKIDAYSERIYQHLMRSLLAEDNRQEVVRVYEEMSKLFLMTFGVMPDQESRTLYREALQSDNHSVISPEMASEQLSEQGEIRGALVCDFDFFKMMYQAQARAVVRSGLVIHTALLTLKSRSNREVSARSIRLAMDNLENHIRLSLRKGDVITRCSGSQFLIMLTSANYENSCKVCQRFVSAFEKKYPHSPIYVDYYVQALNPSTRS